MRWPRWRIGYEGLWAPECTLLGTCQQLVLKADDVDERGDGLEIREFHPTMPDTARQGPISHRLFHNSRQSVGRADLLLFRAGQDERAADARLHRTAANCETSGARW